MEYYPSEEERPYYKVSHLIKLVQKSRKLSSIEKFNNYIRDFTVIAKSLEDRKALSQTDKYDYFWRGVKPVSFHDEIGSAMRHSKLWTDLTNPPPMDEAIKIIKLHLKRDLYRVVDDDEQIILLDDEIVSVSTDTDSDSDSSDSELDKEPKILRDQLANASNIETENLQSWEAQNQEFTTFGKYEYEVFPVEQKHEDLQQRKDESKGKAPECPNRAYVELPKRSTKEHEPSGSKAQVPTILKWDTRSQDLGLDLPNEDIEMGDGTKEDWAAKKQVGPRDGKGPSVPKSKDKLNKPSMDDVVIHDAKDQIKKQASPAYRFASELQENVNVEALFKVLMDKEILLKLGDVFSSSFELCKRLQIALKTQ
ncbi:hypothetical protein BS47DRAFT_1389319 [Hydnum rufescens UP504]|uniref:DUF4100 domain-containing protein n=1 Tax=Hydnum rufescens UP504 TaxID=1448309 RepID=A0A9P6B8C9_9AGAM|nr:hypothetical protein BS47DRAFT_1389319 [Hydnum rufescens UP504]